MVRLMLVLAPVMCILSGIAVSSILSTYMRNLDLFEETRSKKAKKGDPSYPVKSEIAGFIVLLMTFLLVTYTFHCTWVTSEAYSSPSIVLAASQHDGSRIIFDDFREVSLEYFAFRNNYFPLPLLQAYYWLRQNTAEDAKVMSWWDYGYQITAMANRTILVDNNTWNNTHISRVGQVGCLGYHFPATVTMETYCIFQAMSSPEDKAYEIMRELDVNYVLVIFGGLTGYASDGLSLSSLFLSLPSLPLSLQTSTSSCGW